MTLCRPRKGDGRDTSAAAPTAGRVVRPDGDRATAAEAVGRAGRRNAGGVAVRSHVPGRTRLGIGVRLGPLALDRMGCALLRDDCHLVSHDGLSRSVLVLDGRQRPAEAVAGLVATALSVAVGDGEPGTETSDAGRLGEVLSLAAASPEAAASLLRSSRLGLSSAEAAERLTRYGPNLAPLPRERASGEIAADQFANLPVGLLLGSAVLSLASGGVFDALVTLSVVVANAAIATLSGRDSERLIRRLSHPVAHEAVLRRDGLDMRLPASAVVPGDVIALSPGTFVPADARVVSARALTVDESVLTGESLPVDKTAAPASGSPLSVADRHNIVHQGTVVAGGDGAAVAFRTGLMTEIARTGALIGSARAPRPAVEERLDELVTALTIGSVAISVLVLIAGGIRREPLWRLLRSVAALAVSAIPEGLPAVSTTALAVTARAMEREGAVVRTLTAVEELGGVDTVCLDKTGTLTENRMTVTVVSTPSGVTERPAEGWTPGVGHPELTALAEGVALCNEASLSRSTGSATEMALLRFADEIGVDHRAVRLSAPVTAHASRDHTRRWMATEHSDRPSGRSRIAVKGAPEELLPLCATELSGDATEPLSDERRRAILETNTGMARRGLRVLGVARRDGTLGSGDLSGLTWLGLVGLADPVRADARAHVDALHRAGIRTIMITGDQPATALAVAEALSLSRSGVLTVADGPRIATLDEDALGRIALTTSVFARIGPAEKLRIVGALQRAGRRVAMIGDGVNDGPALRAAAVGVAMGRNGTDVAREVADIVLAEDDLGELVRAVARGRAAEDNLRAAIRYLVATNISELALMLGEALHGRGELETPLELLWLNLATDVLPALALATAEPRADVLARPPRPADGPLFGPAETREIVLDAVALAGSALVAHFAMLARAGPGPRTRGAAFMTLALGQIGYALSLRDRSARDGRRGRASARRLDSMLAAAAGLLAVPFVFAPLRRVMGIAPFRRDDAVLCAGLAAAAFTLVEARRLLTPSRTSPGGGARPSPPSRTG